MSSKPPKQRQPRGPPQQQTYNAHNNAPTPPPPAPEPQPSSIPDPSLSPPTTGAKTNTTLNLTVLRRYKPTIQSILSIASNAVLYVFTPDKQAWDKSGIEGTLFVCDCSTPQGLASPSPVNTDNNDMEENYCLLVFNRKSMENFILELWTVHDVEVSGELLIFRYSENGEGGGEEKVRGLWMHEDSEGTRKVNADVVIACWEKARRAKLGAAERAARGLVFEGGKRGGDGGQGQGGGLGRRISLTDLFGGGV